MDEFVVGDYVSYPNPFDPTITMMGKIVKIFDNHYNIKTFYPKQSNGFYDSLPKTMLFKKITDEQKVKLL